MRLTDVDIVTYNEFKKQFCTDINLLNQATYLPDINRFFSLLYNSAH